MLVLHLLHWWKIPVSNVVLRLCKTVYVGVWVLLSASSAQCCTVHSSFCRSSSYCQYPHSHVTLDRTVARIRSLVCSWFSERFRREGAQSQATAWTKKTSWVLLSAGTINSERGAWGSGVPRLITTGESRHCTSRQPAELLTTFPAAPKHPLTRRGLLETIWLSSSSFFFLMNFQSKRVQKTIGTEENKMAYCLKYQTSPFATFLLWSQCFTIILSIVLCSFCIHSNGYKKYSRRKLSRNNSKLSVLQILSYNVFAWRADQRHEGCSVHTPGHKTRRQTVKQEDAGR